ncbi:MAG: hypothetical protein ACJA02_000309 [Myxococcota bacterium]|jgi:hypothetical protein
MILTASSSKQVLISKFKIYQNIHHFFIAGFLLCLILQASFWFKAEKFKPDISIVPKAPNLTTVRALSFGDEQFYFRTHALKIENAGDTFGRFTSLKKYDYSNLYQWFKLLDELDHKSKYIPTLAATYYSQTQNKQDTIHVVNYLDEYASVNIDEDWWWMFQAFIIARRSLNDDDLALKLAYKLSENENEEAPIWTKQLPAIVHARLGDDCAAFSIIKKILSENESGERSIDPEEMDFMRHFIKQRISDLKEKNFDPTKCKQ